MVAVYPVFGVTVKIGVAFALTVCDPIGVTVPFEPLLEVTVYEHVVDTVPEADAGFDVPAAFDAVMVYA